jgi:hypothetical protein
VLRVLSENHARELYELAPRLIGALSMICRPDEQTAGDPGITVPARGEYR